MRTKNHSQATSKSQERDAANQISVPKGEGREKLVLPRWSKRAWVAIERMRAGEEISSREAAKVTRELEFRLIVVSDLRFLKDVREAQAETGKVEVLLNKRAGCLSEKTVCARGVICAGNEILGLAE